MINEKHRNIDEYTAYLQAVFAEFEPLFRKHKDRLDEIRQEEMLQVQGDGHGPDD